jgi:type II secretion system protein N
MLTYGKWFGYGVFTVVVTMAFLYARFPSEAVRAYLISEAACADPPMDLSLRGVRPSFPPGVTLVEAGIAPKGTPGEDLLRARTVTVRPAMWSWVTGRARYLFDAHAYNGHIAGHVHVKGDTSDPLFSTAISLKGLQIGLHPSLSSLLGQEVAGLLEGEIVYEGGRNHLMGGTGEGTIVISDGKVKLPQPILGIEAIDVDRLSMKASLKDKRVSVAHVTVEGRAIKGELSGTIVLNPDVAGSRLDLKGIMEPLGGLLGNVKANAGALSFLNQGLKRLRRSFVIQGTFKNPAFRFL